MYTLGDLAGQFVREPMMMVYLGLSSWATQISLGEKYSNPSENKGVVYNALRT